MKGEKGEDGEEVRTRESKCAGCVEGRLNWGEGRTGNEEPDKQGVRDEVRWMRGKR